MPTITGEQWGIILGALALIIGIPAFVFSIVPSFRSIKAWGTRKQIAIFGPQAAGKSSLVSYLRRESVPRKHIPTAGAPTYGRIVYDLTGEKVTYFTARTLVDVGGEFREQWIAVVREYNPHGLIYVIDTSDFPIEETGFAYLFEIYKRWTEQQLVRNIRTHYNLSYD